MRLYELTEQYDEVMNLLYDGETDEQTILDTLESIEGEIEDKAGLILTVSAGICVKVNDHLTGRKKFSDDDIELYKKLSDALSTGKLMGVLITR